MLKWFLHWLFVVFFNVLTLLYRKNKLVKTYKMFLLIVIIKINEIINK